MKETFTYITYFLDGSEPSGYEYIVELLENVVPLGRLTQKLSPNANIAHHASICIILSSISNLIRLIYVFHTLLTDNSHV